MLEFVALTNSCNVTEITKQHTGDISLDVHVLCADLVSDQQANDEIEEIECIHEIQDIFNVVLKKAALPDNSSMLEQHDGDVTHFTVQFDSQV